MCAYKHFYNAIIHFLQNPNTTPPHSVEEGTEVPCADELPVMYQVHTGVCSLLMATLHVVGCRPLLVQKRKEVSDLPNFIVTVSTQGHELDHLVLSVAIALEVCRPFRHGVQQVERCHFRQAYEDSTQFWF